MKVMKMMPKPPMAVADPNKPAGAEDQEIDEATLKVVLPKANHSSERHAARAEEAGRRNGSRESDEHPVQL